MVRYSVVEKAVLVTLGNPRLTLVELVQAIHAVHPDIKHVAFIKTYDLKYFTVWVKYNDRKTDTFNFMRGNWSEYNA